MALVPEVKISESNKNTILETQQLLEKLKKFKEEFSIDLFSADEIARLGQIQEQLKKITTNSKGFKKSISELNAKEVEQLVRISELYRSIGEYSNNIAKLTKFDSKDIEDIVKHSHEWSEVLNDIKLGSIDITKQSSEYQEIYNKIQNLSDKQKKDLDGIVKNINRAKNEISGAEENIKQINSKSGKLIDNFSKAGTIVSTINRGLAIGKQLFNAITNDWTKFNDVSVKTGRAIGMTREQIKNLQKETQESTKKMAMAYGLEYDALLKFQSTYNKLTQRSVQFNERNKENMSALSVLVGETTASDIVNQFDKMGGSLDTSTAYMMKQQEMARKMGLSAEESTNIMSKNMGMLNKYSFKNGVNGFQRMVTLSQQLRFNMESVSGSIDKASNWEGAVDMASRMQMLGGSYAAQFSNPGQVLYEALNDAEAFTNRIVNTFASKGTFNTKTGKVDISPLNKAYMREAAKAINMSYDELLNMVNRSGYNEAAISEMRNGLTKEQKESLANKSEWNTSSHKFEVTYIDKNGNEVTKSVAEIRPEDMKEIQQGIIPDNLDDNVSNIYKLLRSEYNKRARESVSFAERQKGASSAISAGKAQVEGLWSNGMDNVGLGMGTGLNNGVGTWVPTAIGAGGLLLGGASIITAHRFNKRTAALFEQKLGGKPSLSTGSSINTGSVNSQTVNASQITGTPRGIGTASYISGNNGKVWQQVTTKTGTQGLQMVGTKRIVTGSAAQAILRNSKPYTPTGVTNIYNQTARSSFTGGGLTGRGVGIGMAAGLVGSGMQFAGNRLVETGKIKQGGFGDYALGVGGGALSGAATGAMIGSIIPGIGTGIGAAVGALAGGAISAIKKSNETKVQAKALSASDGGTINGDINLNVTGSIKLVAPSGASTELIRELDRPDVQNKIKRIVAYNMAKSKAGGGTVNMGSQDIQQAGY